MVDITNLSAASQQNAAPMDSLDLDDDLSRERRRADMEAFDEAVKDVKSAGAAPLTEGLAFGMKALDAATKLLKEMGYQNDSSILSDISIGRGWLNEALRSLDATPPNRAQITAGDVIRWAGETLLADRRTDSERALAHAIRKVANGGGERKGGERCGAADVDDLERELAVIPKLRERISQFDSAIQRIAAHVHAVCGGVDTEGDGPGGHTAAEIIRCIDKMVAEAAQRAEGAAKKQSTPEAEVAFDKWWQTWRQQNGYPNTERMRRAGRSVYEAIAFGSIDWMTDELRRQGHLRSDGPEQR